MSGRSNRLPVRRSGLRLAGAGAALLSMFTLAGCSVGNLTGFDFPTFGLTKKSDEVDREATGSIGQPPSGQRMEPQ